ncbi:DMT family transporter [Devosia sp. XK-2]|uniref:DMT family transporter n=1 Tax=Devosia sp. XK-2 TaxID=3126689 RepID=UPI0030CDEA05
MRVFLLSSLAMIAFAANSLLARLALVGNGTDPLTYTGLRLLSGALILALLVRLRRSDHAGPLYRSGTWKQALALFGYALAFSLAYVRLGAAMGALVLFASVQIGMVTRAIVAGDRPGPFEWLGLALAGGAFVYLVSPGLSAPDALGSALMILAGLCWAAYSLLGRGSAHPLEDTAGNFLRCLPPALAILGMGLVGQLPQADGVTYAIMSGAIASGLGYAVWYGALPALSRTRAAVIQLSVPVIAAVAAIPLLGEASSLRLVIAAVLILGGIALATLLSGRRRAQRTG